MLSWLGMDDALADQRRRREQRLARLECRDAHGYGRQDEPAEGEPLEWLLEDGSPFVTIHYRVRALGDTG